MCKKDTFIEGFNIEELVRNNSSIFTRLLRKKLSRITGVLYYKDKIVLNRPDYRRNKNTVSDLSIAIYFKDIEDCIYDTEKRVLTFKGKIVEKYSTTSIVYKEPYDIVAKNKLSINLEKTDWQVRNKLLKVLEDNKIIIYYKRRIR